MNFRCGDFAPAQEHIHVQEAHFDKLPRTLDYGRAFYSFNIALYQNLLETIKKDIP